MCLPFGDLAPAVVQASVFLVVVLVVDPVVVLVVVDLVVVLVVVDLVVVLVVVETVNGSSLLHQLKQNNYLQNIFL